MPNLVNATQYGGWHDVPGTKSLIHVSALTAASLFTRLMELRAEFDTLHSIGMIL